jgi:hypothetical protein
MKLTLEEIQIEKEALEYSLKSAVFDDLHSSDRTINISDALRKMRKLEKMECDILKQLKHHG